MNLSCGIVGLPNVGKSTLFNSLTQASVAAENYPFCTIDPSVGIVPVPDQRLDTIASLVQPQKVIPAVVEIVDIAGLVAGASKGEGLGNQFLSHIRETKAILHVVRCFVEDNVIHVAGKVSPKDDIDIINTELLLADLESIEKRLLKAEKLARAAGDKDKARLVGLLQLIKGLLEDGKPVRAHDFGEDAPLVESLGLLSAKPVLYVANVGDDGFKNNPYLAEVEAIAKAENAQCIAISAKLEAELAQMTDDEKEIFLAEIGFTEPCTNRLARSAYALLGLQTFFTAGPKELRAWTIKKGATAPQAAGTIHTDFERGFIRAEVVHYEDFIASGGEDGARANGKWRLEGKDYIMQDGDIVHFRFNV